MRLGQGQTSSKGSSGCNICRRGFYDAASSNATLELNVTRRDPIVCNACPDGASCTEEGITIDTMKINEGYYRFNKLSDTIYPCLKAEHNCVGGVGSRCKTGSLGPTCAFCESEYYLDTTDAACVECDHVKSNDSFNTLIVVLVLAGLAGTVYAVGVAKSKDFKAVTKRWKTKAKLWKSR